MALLTSNGDPDDAANSLVFWAVALLIVVFVIVAVVVGLTRIL